MSNIKKISTEELETTRDELEQKIVDIRHQIDYAKSNANAFGEYSDVDWFNKAKFALSKSGLQHQQILRELADRRKAEARKRSETIDRQFIEVCKRRLEPDVFKEYMDEAHIGVGV